MGPRGVSSLGGKNRTGGDSHGRGGGSLSFHGGGAWEGLLLGVVKAQGGVGCEVVTVTPAIPQQERGPLQSHQSLLPIVLT